MSEADVSMMRLLDHARALACRVCQSIKTREMVLLPATGDAVLVADVASARSWLRQYAQCGRYGRQCFHNGRSVCFVSRQWRCSWLAMQIGRKHDGAF